jgi:DNA polymerase
MPTIAPERERVFMSTAFISHDTQDAEFAHRLADGLREAGIGVWIAPESIRPGEEFVDAIQRGLTEATHFIIVLSPDALESNWVKLEMNTAIRLERQGKLSIAPINYRECTPPLLLGNFQWLDYAGDDDAMLREIIGWMGVTDRRVWSKRRSMSAQQQSERKTQLDHLAAQIRACTLCPLHETRHLAVPGGGPPNASLMLIGEAPGKEEDRNGIAFSWASGQFLEELLNLIGVRREDVFITNIVKCHPPDQRDPLPGEVRACADYLDQQITLVDAPVLVSLGSPALARLLPGARLSAVHGFPKQIGDRTLFPMYHPAAALYRHQYRGILIEDFKKMAEILSGSGRG